MESLSKYDSIAKGLLIKHNLNYLIQDTQAFGEIVSELAWADYNWDDTKQKNNSKEGFRKTRFRWYISSLIKEAERKKRTEFSIWDTDPWYENSNKNDNFEKLINADCLLEREKDYIRRLVNGESIREISKVYGTTYNAMVTRIQNMKRKLRKNFTMERGILKEK